jgi:hypothetical protein
MKKTNAIPKNSELTAVFNSHFQNKVNLARESSSSILLLRCAKYRP